MDSNEIHQLNERFSQSKPEEIVAWAMQAGSVVVTTNFRPYEAVILHMAKQALADVKVLWVDHGTNLPETYKFADRCIRLLALNIKTYVPKMTAAHWLALNGGVVPMPDEIEKVESFSRIMKLEPFERGMKDLSPKMWITALRKEQNPQRAATLQPLMWDEKFQCLKINPILEWTSTELQAYLEKHQLPNELTYYDPAKGDEKHECGLHAKLVTDQK
jgi:phosphoadenosine phosphosulfate reductase